MPGFYLMRTDSEKAAHDERVLPILLGQVQAILLVSMIYKHTNENWLRFAFFRSVSIRVYQWPQIWRFPNLVEPKARLLRFAQK
jgi:hypothetical protein